MRENPTGDRYASLFGALSKENKAIVAFSGGTDSTFLLEVCVKALGAGNVTAATALSSCRHSREAERAGRTARRLGVRHILLHTRELELEQVRFNRPDRCYHCKKHLYSVLMRTIKEKGAAGPVLDATTSDEAAAHRPGLKALNESGIRCPLVQAGMTKDDVKCVLKDMGLTNEISPEESCLLTRFPYGERVTDIKLRRVRQAEESLFDMGFSLARVRCHGNAARIELKTEEMPGILVPGIRREILRRFKPVFRRITLDMEGFRSGSMDDPGE